MENPDRFRTGSARCTDHPWGDQDDVVQGSDIEVLVKGIVATGNNCLFESKRKGFVEEFELDLNMFSYVGYFKQTVELPHSFS